MGGFTPGPWVTARAKTADNTGGFDVAIMDSAGKIIGECFEHVGHGERGSYDIRPAQANARLIAAAPELLEALQIAAAMLNEPKGLELRLARSDTFQGLVDKINSAITKATSPSPNGEAQ